MKLHLLFESNSLEERFRRLVTDSKEEIGGWFLRGYVEDHGMSWSKLKKLGLTPIYVIEHIIIAPNHAKNPETTWSPWDIEKATELSRATANFYGNWPIHFHTHPGHDDQTWTRKPSDNDVSFWQWLGGACSNNFGCIVTDRPLRLWPWSVDVRIAASPGATTVTKECGGFLSWRSRILREIKKSHIE